LEARLGVRMPGYSHENAAGDRLCVCGRWKRNLKLLIRRSGLRARNDADYEQN